MGDITRCNQKNPDCPEPPAYRFTWAGHDEAAICAKHAPRLAGIAAAMGYYVQLIPLTLDGDGRDGFNGAGPFEG